MKCVVVVVVVVVTYSSPLTCYRLFLCNRQMINNGLAQVLVLEDDVRFEPDFRNQLQYLLEEANALSNKFHWELM